MKRFRDCCENPSLKPIDRKNGDTELQMTFPEGSKGDSFDFNPYDPGWEAKLDGTEISVIPVMQSLIIEIPAGSKNLF